MSELKPCPFCGGNRIQYQISGYFQPWTHDGMKLWYHCSCFDCGAELDQGDAQTMKKAAEQWDSRAEGKDKA
jgi:Lar family restriction alleviation protein